MTFDNALEKVKALGEKGATTWFGPQLDDYTHVKGHLEQSDIESLIYHLKEAYAPTIEMTKAEQIMLFNYMEMSSFREFMDVILYQDGDLYESLSDEEIAQAWLHPETIKVVD